MTALEQEARATLAWIDVYGDRDGDGYVEYSPLSGEAPLLVGC